MKFVKYTVETPYPYKFYPCKMLREAKRKCTELRKQGIKAQIICLTENGNDYILKED